MITLHYKRLESERLPVNLSSCQLRSPPVPVCLGTSKTGYKFKSPALCNALESLGHGVKETELSLHQSVLNVYLHTSLVRKQSDLSTVAAGVSSLQSLYSTKIVSISEEGSLQ